MRRIWALSDATGRFVVLAGQHMRAAEFFASVTLLDKATTYLKPLSEIARVTADDAPIAMADRSDIVLPAYLLNDVRDLEMRAAILKARLSRAPADLVAARAMLNAKDVALLERAVDSLQEHGEGVCDVGDDKQWAEIRQACQSENDFEGRVLRYWRARAQLDLLDDASSHRRTDSFEPAIRLLQYKLRDPFEAVQSSIREAAGDDIAALLLQRFEAENAAAFKITNSNPVLTEDEKRRQCGYALGFLIRAERFTPPTENASRFRQIAERYLAVWRSLSHDPSAQEMLSPALAREAVYLERVLSALPQIGSGDLSPSK